MSLQLGFEQWLPYPLEQLFLFFADPNNLPRIMPPSTATRIDGLRLVPPAGRDLGPGIAGIGSEIVTSFKVLPFLPLRSAWIAVITEFEWNHHFADIQKIGPFKSFHHRHELRAQVHNGVAGTIVKDEIELELGFGWIGWLVERLFIRHQMAATFHYRQRTLEKLLSEDAH